MNSDIALIERHMDRPLAEGEHCFGPVCDTLLALGHLDPSGAYAALSRAEVRRLPDVPAAIERALGGVPVAPDEAQPGDVGARRFGDFWCVGMMARRWLWKSERGLIVGGKAERAWRLT